MDSNRLHLLKRNPFPQRPWMENNGAAAAAGGSTGLKGIVAGGIYSYLFIGGVNLFLKFDSLFHYIFSTIILGITGGIEICITFPTGIGYF